MRLLHFALDEHDDTLDRLAEKYMVSRSQVVRAGLDLLRETSETRPLVTAERLARAGRRCGPRRAPRGGR